MADTIRITERSEEPTAGVRRLVPMSELAGFFSHAFGETMRVLASQGILPSGPPFGKYYGMPNAAADVEAGFPISAPIQPSGEVVAGSLPGGRVVEAVHVGSYDTLAETYRAVEEFFAAEGLTPGPTMWESFVSDPDAEPDPSRVRTLVCWLVFDDVDAPV